MTYNAKNTFVHPDIDVFNFLVKKQDELKDLKIRWQQFAAVDKYRIPDSASVHMRFDTARAIEDSRKPGSGVEGLYDALKAIIAVRMPARHDYHGRGVELSAAGRPMHVDNKCISVEEGGIKEAVRVAGTKDIIVSKDVWGQLDAEQRESLAAADGAHQYAEENIDRVTLKNPTGVWPKGSGNIGCTIPVRPGVLRTYHITSKTIAAELKKILIPAQEVEIGTRLATDYGLDSGIYSVSENGIFKTGECFGEGMAEPTVRRIMEDFVMRDKRGHHGADVTQMGPCSYKVDGLFCWLNCEAGTATFKYRNGATFQGKCEFDMQCAFEEVGDVLYLLYVEKYKGNYVRLDKSLQDYFRNQLEFTLRIGDRFVTSTKSIDNLPHDGIVVWGTQRQTFYKEVNTVDITKQMARVLENDYGKVFEGGLDSLVEGKIYEFAVRDAMTLKFVKERPVKSKVLPNKLKNVVATMSDPNLGDVRRYHQTTYKATYGEGKCACTICEFL